MSLRLRRLRRQDGPQLLAWRNAPELAAHMYSEHLIGEAEHAAWLQAALTRLDRRYWIIVLEERDVGLADLVRIDPSAGSCEWAFYLADPVTRGRGVGSAMAWLLLGHVFQQLGLDEVNSEVLADNAASLHLHERVGFLRTALWPAHVAKAGRPCDVVALRLLAAGWAGGRTRLEHRVAERFDLSALQIEP